MNLSNYFLDLNDHRSGIACLKRLIQVEPTNAAAWQNLGVAFFLRERYDDGINACHQALRNEPSNTAAAFNLALGLSYVRRYNEALVHVRSAKLIDPRNAMLDRLEFRLLVLRLRNSVARWFGRLVRAKQA